jgi:hypothetical protein
MTTVGYGDYFPQTVLGRIIIFLVCIWGIFIISLMVIALNNILSLDDPENKSFNLINKLTGRNSLKKLAESIIRVIIKISLILKGKVKEIDLNDKSRDLKNLLADFKIKRR